jgi:predicted dehydrogenase
MVTMPQPRNKIATSNVPAPCRVLVIGLGSIGQRHSGLLAERPEVELVVCDGAAARLEETRRRLGDARVQLCDSVDAAMSHGPDVVFVCTPDASHVTLAMHALRAGADLFVEKPIAHSVSAATELVDAARQAGRFLQVGYMLRYDPGLQYIHRVVASGELGVVTGGRAMIGTYLTLVNAKNPYREREAFVLPYDYTHEFDFIRWIFGEPVDLVARGRSNG